MSTHLFALLRIALRGFFVPADYPDTPADWRAIAVQSRRQTVEGLVADAVGLLPEGLRPPVAVRMELVGAVRQTERAHATSVAALRGVVEELGALGVRPVLMKGLSVAGRYSVPEHRAVGDIDLFFDSPGDLAKANAWAREHGTGLEDFYAKHLVFTFRGVPIENHSRLCDFRHKEYNRRLDKIVGRELASVAFAAGPYGTLELPPTLYAFFLLCHKAEHVVEDGLGLRQVCDWAVFLDREGDKIDREKFCSWVSALDLWRLAGAFGRICVERLGLDEGKLPFALRAGDDKGCALLLGQMMAGGNFGRQFYGYKGRVSKLEDMWRTMWIKLPRYARIARLWPREALACYRAMAVRGVRRLARM